MDAGKLLLGATAGMILLAVVIGAFVVGVPGLIGGSNSGDVDSADLPPGVGEQGVEDPNATARAHDEALSGEAYTLDLQATRSAGSGSGYEIHQTLRANGDGQYLMDVERSGSRAFDLSVWANESVAVGKITRNNRSAYQQMDPGQIRSTATGSISIEEFLRAGDFEPTGSTTKGGRELVVLEADAATDRAASIFNAQRVESYSGTAKVDSEGRVFSLEVEVTLIDSQGQEVTQTTTVDLSKVGSTSVQRPEWVSEALARTSSARLRAVGTSPAGLA